MQIALAICNLFFLLATLLPMLRVSHWTIRGFDFPRFQFFVFGLVLLTVQILNLTSFQRFPVLLIIVTICCIFWQLFWIIPYTVFWPKEVEQTHDKNLDKELCLLTSNVLYSNRNADTLLALVEKYRPDVLVTLESDHWWEEQLNILDKKMPYSIKCAQENTYGMHVYSRLPLSDYEISYLVEEDVPSIHTSIELRSGDKIRAHFLHPAPPSPTENPESNERDAELLIVAQSVAESDQPVIVAGDLNDVAWSSTTRLFRKISGLLDPRVGRGMFNTFHAKLPLLRWPLDHVFHSEHFTLKSILRLSSIDSDHFPLLAKLTYSPLQGRNQEGLQASSQDDYRAREICAEKGVKKSDVPEPRSI